MNRKQQIDIIRKRNIDLSKKIDELTFQIEYNNALNSNGYDSAKKIINELEHIKSEWNEALYEIYEKDAEYQHLINDLKTIKTIMLKRGFKTPLYRRILNKFIKE